MVFSKILVAIDGSETSDLALDYAYDLAIKYGAEVLIVSVLDTISKSLISRGMLFAADSTTQYLEELEQFYKRILGEALEKEKEVNIKLKLSTRLLKGRAADKIVETANEGGFDLIVIGSRGLGGIKEFFLGSVSDRVADEAKCPVLIVKKNIE
jgi:nucleotide-binding universal stress UspA family protein